MLKPPDPLLAALRKVLYDPQYEPESRPGPGPGLWHGNVRDLWMTFALDNVEYYGVIENFPTPNDLSKELIRRSNDLFSGGVLVVVDDNMVTLEREEVE